MMSGWVLCTRFFSSSILFLIPFMLIWSMTMFCPLVDCCVWVVCLWWGVVLSVLGVVTFCVGVWMVQESWVQSCLYCRCCMCAWTQCVCVCCYIWLWLLLIVCDRGYKSKWLECLVRVCRRAKIWLDVPRFCEEQNQPGGRERRTACQKKTESGPHLWGQGLCSHNLCRCLQQSNVVQAMSSWTFII